MADKPKEDSAEKAYAAAASAPVKPAKDKAQPRGKFVPKPAAAKKQVAPESSVPAPTPVAAPIAQPVAESAAAPAAVMAPELETELPTLTELKETIMATAPQSETVKTFTDTATDTMTDAMSELQSRAQAAYEKGTEAMSEFTDFAKGNVEAIVESGKIVATGFQSMSKGYVEEAKSAYETLTADLKEMAAVKSPTELFQLQGKIMRRNFDALVAAGSKNTEAAIKLANDAFAPISGRVNLATEKLTKAA